jgi:hypothetical protein
MGTTTLEPSLFDQLTQSSLGTASWPASERGSAPIAGRTLEDLILATWTQVQTGSAALCPVCQGELEPVWSAGARPVGGRCQDCGSRLS